MNQVPINRRINNREIICKIMDSVAKTCDCRIKYSTKDDCLCFSGNKEYINYIAEQTLAFFSISPALAASEG